MKKNKLPNIVSTAILTLIVIFTWIVLSVLRIFMVKPSPEVSAEILKPVNATLDTNSLDTLEGRIFFERGDIPLPIFTPEESPLPEETVPPTEIPVPQETPLP
ncbi:MAG: hypothetical protein Q8P91_02395 [bacterium]|nr:hypothetical protein [bacterium]MDZ4209927.1 hypothetical protein [Candidatus Curtissbacteria bacterium]